MYSIFACTSGPSGTDSGKYVVGANLYSERVAETTINSIGAVSVTGASFISRNATSIVVSTALVAGIAGKLGVERWTGRCRVITNVIGDSVTEIVVASRDNWLNWASPTKSLAK
jgi:Na+/H+-dicarboxylate symporter